MGLLLVNEIGVKFVQYNLMEHGLNGLDRSGGPHGLNV